MSVAGSKGVAFKATTPRYTKTGKCGYVIAKADGQRLAGTEQRAQRRGVRALLDKLPGVILDLVGQGHQGHPADELQGSDD